MMSKPFLKWAGGKSKLVPYIQNNILKMGVKPTSKGYCRFVEPFVGSAAVTMGLELNFDEYVLNDVNADLINLYRALQLERDEFIKYVQSYFTSENATEFRYYELRELFNNSADVMERSALFVYLNRHGFNGLCRYNKSGAFNVPFGRYKSVTCPVEQMKAFVEKSDRMVLMSGGFQEVFELCLGQNDVIYCDPPYAPLSTGQHDKSFTAYAKDSVSFGWEQQVELLRCVEHVQRAERMEHVLCAERMEQIVCNEKGVGGVIVSNHDTIAVRELYKSASYIDSLEVRRSIAAKGDHRGKVGELMACWKL